MTVRNRRLAAAGAFAVVVVALLAWAYRPRPVLVDIEPVRVGAMSVEISEEARTRIREVYMLSAPVSGRLERVVAEPGDEAVAGETVLARIRPADPVFLDRRAQSELESALRAAEAARDAAAAEVRRASVEHDRARAQFARYAPLVERGAVSAAEFDDVRAARDVARAALDAAQEALRAREADVARAEAALITPGDDNAGEDGDCCVELRAPVSGVVLRVLQESAGVVAAGAPIVEIGDPSDLEIVCEMLSTDAVRISEGAPVRIDGWGGDELAGRVRLVEPSAFTKVSALGVEEQRVNVVIDIDAAPDDWAGLAHQFRVDVHVQEWAGEGELVAPVAALFRHEGRWSAYAVERGRARLRSYEIGRMNAREAQVLGGALEGVRVIVHPSERVREGVRVAQRD